MATVNCLGACGECTTRPCSASTRNSGALCRGAGSLPIQASTIDSMTEVLEWKRQRGGGTGQTQWPRCARWPDLPVGPFESPLQHLLAGRAGNFPEWSLGTIGMFWGNGEAAPRSAAAADGRARPFASRRKLLLTPAPRCCAAEGGVRSRILLRSGHCGRDARVCRPPRARAAGVGRAPGSRRGRRRARRLRRSADDTVWCLESVFCCNFSTVTQGERKLGAMAANKGRVLQRCAAA